MPSLSFPEEFLRKRLESKQDSGLFSGGDNFQESPPGNQRRPWGPARVRLDWPFAFLVCGETVSKLARAHWVGRKPALQKNTRDEKERMQVPVVQCSAFAILTCVMGHVASASGVHGRMQVPVSLLR